MKNIRTLRKQLYGTLIVCMLGIALPTAWGQNGGSQNQPAPQISSASSQEQTSASRSQQSQRRRKRIAVVDFEVPTELIQSLVQNKKGDDSSAIVVQVQTAASRVSTVVSDMLISALVQMGSFDVVERTQLEHIFKEHQLKKEDLLDVSKAPETAKLLGIDLILGGKLTEFGVKEQRGGGIGVLSRVLTGVGVDVRKSTARAVVDARLIDAATGRVLTTVQGRGENKEEGVAIAGGRLLDFLGGVSVNSTEWTESRIGRATRAAVEQIVQQLREKFPLQATVMVLLPDGSIILDVGSFAGIKVDDQFELVRETVLSDEQTGEVAWREQKKIGLARVTEVQDDRCKCVLVDSTEKPQKGDIAVLKRPESSKQEPAPKKKR